ncbi:DUF3343 domain-containing protein [Miniphocaeibacter halophilus]|uniref:DUF3343 domain-containing protein n=1 Tax=Miniphocaeibacter halophilus TaxID=2931922 RepID=A0AC61MZL4_9FIRM|nr:DUF3343 domain-containing protein [Miniphocaeibacter halophilus]QQK08895.1 DUF3343 domain-containing protein [Miniphocaeibacter halophilus]
MKEKSIFTFHTISQVLKFEKLLKKNKIDVQLRPVPRKISSSCGNCAYVNTEDVEIIKDLSGENKIEFENIYKEEDIK